MGTVGCPGVTEAAEGKVFLGNGDNPLLGLGRGEKCQYPSPPFTLCFTTGSDVSAAEERDKMLARSLQGGWEHTCRETRANS